MVKRYDFDNDGNRTVGPDGIYVLASDYERLEAAMQEILGSYMYMAAWDIANAALAGSPASETLVDEPCCPKCDSEICICGLGSPVSGLSELPSKGSK